MNKTIYICLICNQTYLTDNECDHNTITVNCTDEEYKKIKRKISIKNKIKKRGEDS